MGTIAIAALRTKVLAILDDASLTKFSNNQIDQAVRDALKEYTVARPIQATYSFDADGQQVIVMPTSFIAFQVLDLYKDEAYPQYHYTFYAYYLDEQWQIETPNNTIPANTALFAVYTKVNTIDGLDSAAGTTIPDAEIETLALGAAGFALLSRAVNRSEANNLDNDTLEGLKKLGDSYIAKFNAALKQTDKGYITANWTLDTDKIY